MHPLLVIAFLTTVSWVESASDDPAAAAIPKCSFQLTESIPVGLKFEAGQPVFNSTFHELKRLVSTASHQLDIAAFYFTLIGTDVLPDPDSSSGEGEELLRTIIEAGRRGVKIRIARNADKMSSSSDLEQLRAVGAEIRPVNFTRLLGAGILHTKFLVADGHSFYIGSANMDWRALTQVKEAGVTVRKCPDLARDLLKIFEVYWILGQEDSRIPDRWPAALSTNISSQTPLHVNLGGTESDVFIASAPRPLNPNGRTNDIDALISVIDGAKKFINIAVMDYFPTFLFTRKPAFWPVIDDALRRAAIERGVRVRILASKWSHTRKTMFAFLSSLNSFRHLSPRGRIEAKVFVVPTIGPDQERIPFARVNHNKYMVTDESAYIGTSNWSADYFVNTGGVSIVSRESFSSCYRNDSLRESLVHLFDRDWYSGYAQDLTN
jgi:phospholipase D3/4